MILRRTLCLSVLNVLGLGMLPAQIAINLVRKDHVVTAEAHGPHVCAYWVYHMIEHAGYVMARGKCNARSVREQGKKKHEVALPLLSVRSNQHCHIQDIDAQPHQAISVHMVAPNNSMKPTTYRAANSPFDHRLPLLDRLAVQFNVAEQLDSPTGSDAQFH